VAQAAFREEFRKRRIPVEAFSAGTSALDGQKPPQFLVESARGLGLDVEKHRSQSLTDDLLAAADLIVVATVAHARVVLSKNATLADRTFALAELPLLAAEVRNPSESSWDFGDWRAAIADLRDPASYWHREHIPSDIPDPYGGSKRTYAAVTRQIASHVSAFMASWLDPISLPESSSLRSANNNT
jgi:protein-tyrosine phosphatase